MTPIRLTIDGELFQASLDDSEAGRQLAAALPVQARMSRWGDEYYGGFGQGLGVDVDETAREVMEVGELAYWPPGKALCIFFGPTPVSEGDEPRAASPVLPVGRIEGDVERLKALGESVQVQVESA